MAMTPESHAVGCPPATLRVRIRRRARGLSAIVVIAGLAGCRPRTVDYHLPATVLLPINAAGITDRSAEYGPLFCDSLAHLGTEGGPWEGCATYIRSTGSGQGEAPDLDARYRVLFISGIGSQCGSAKLQAFSDVKAHLVAHHGMTAEYQDVPALGSCEYNAERIAAYIRTHTQDDKRPYIVVGYSKGAPDLMVMLAKYPDVRSSVTALLTVAGAVGGSRLPDQADKAILKAIHKLKFEIVPCDEGDGRGLDSLRRDVRMDFLRAHPKPDVPTYALVAVSDRETTSKLLLPTWEHIAVYSKDEDSQVIESEGIPPGANYLGALKADHWAVAMPFESDPASKDLVDRNHFPRTAAVESALRLIVKDLNGR